MHIRKFARKTFAATETADNDNVTVKLDRHALLTCIRGRLHGTVTVANNAGAAAGNGLLALNLIQNMHLQGDVSDEYIVGVDLAQAARRSQQLAGISLITNTGVTVAAHAVDIRFAYYFDLRHAHLRMQPESEKFGIKAWEYDALNLIFDEKSLDTAITPNAAGDLTAALFLDTEGIYEEEFEENALYNRIRYLAKTIPLTAAGEGDEVSMAGRHELRSLYMDVFNNTIVSDDIVGNLKLCVERGERSIRPIDNDWEELQGRGDGDFGIAHTAGGLLVILDGGDGRGLLNMQSPSAKLTPYVTGAVTATSNIKAIQELVYRA